MNRLSRSFQLAVLFLVAAALVAYLAKTKASFSSSDWLPHLLSKSLRTRSRRRRRRSPLLDIPGPPALPAIGAKWCFWRSVGKYGHLQGNDETEQRLLPAAGVNQNVPKRLREFGTTLPNLPDSRKLS